MRAFDHALGAGLKVAVVPTVSHLNINSEGFRNIIDWAGEKGLLVNLEKGVFITGNVIAKVCELDTLAFALTPAFAFHAAAENLAADKLQSLQLRQHRGGQQR